MKTTTLIAVICVAFSTVAIIFLMPARVTIQVGDHSGKVRQIGQYGFGKSFFNLAGKRDSDGKELKPSAISIGGGWHLLIWHNDHVDSMTHFRHVQVNPNTYGEWHDVNAVQSFTISRPSLIPYFVGVAMTFSVSLLLGRYHAISFILFALLLTFVALMVFVLSTLAETFALLHFLFGVGWISAAMIGYITVLPRPKTESAADENAT